MKWAGLPPVEGDTGLVIKDERMCRGPGCSKLLMLIVGDRMTGFCWTCEPDHEPSPLKPIPPERPHGGGGRKKNSNVGSTAHGVHGGAHGGKPSDRTPVGGEPLTRSADGERRVESTTDGGILSPPGGSGRSARLRCPNDPPPERSQGSVKADGVTAGETAIS